MNLISRTLLGALLGTMSFLALPLSAGPYGDSLGKCLVSSTTSTQKATLVRWMFAMMALHPEVRSDASITAAQRTALSKDTALLFQQLLTDSCRAETLEAIQYEGAGTIESSFALLGQVAARELFAHPAVAEGMSEFGQFVDEEKMRSLVEP
jgi:hypothetical protein